MDRDSEKWHTVVRDLSSFKDARLYELILEVLDNRRIHTADTNGDFNIEVVALVEVDYLKITGQTSHLPHASRSLLHSFAYGGCVGCGRPHSAYWRGGMSPPAACFWLLFLGDFGLVLAP